MAITDLFSKRQKRQRGEVADVYTYDDVPTTLRNQILHIIRDAIGKDIIHDNAASAYKYIHSILCREYGTFCLAEHCRNIQQELQLFFVYEQSTDRIMDFIELSFKVIEKWASGSSYKRYTSTQMTPSSAVAELNARFKEHSVGYQYESGEIIRVDSEFMHSEIVKPTLTILYNSSFAGANEEFLKAHEHYRHGRHKECLVEALKAFESTMKAICAQRGWATAPTDTAKKLIATCLGNELVPLFLQAEFTSLAAMLEGGVPTVRNKLGGHGQGTTPTQVPAYMARYALNTTASCILLLAEANDALK